MHHIYIISQSDCHCMYSRNFIKSESYHQVMEAKAQGLEGAQGEVMAQLTPWWA